MDGHSKDSIPLEPEGRRYEMRYAVHLGLLKYKKTDSV